MAHPAIASLADLDWVDVRIFEELSFLSQNDGYATPGRAYLANCLGCSIRTVSRHLTKLCQLGYLQRQLRSYRKASGEIVARTNLYKVSCGISGRIKSFLGTIGQRFKPRPTGGTRLSRVPKTKKIKPIRKQNPSPGGEPTLLSPHVLERIPLLRIWLTRGQGV